jgi:hypothetical protein
MRGTAYLPSNAVFCSSQSYGVTIERGGPTIVRHAAVRETVRRPPGFLEGNRGIPRSRCDHGSALGEAREPCRSTAMYTTSVAPFTPWLPSWMPGCKAAGGVWPMKFEPEKDEPWQPSAPVEAEAAHGPGPTPRARRWLALAGLAVLGLLAAAYVISRSRARNAATQNQVFSGTAFEEPVRRSNPGISW